MVVLFFRALILYLLVFTVIRLTGKRQLSELQPFDLVITLLIADLASEPVSDTSIPLMYGIVPIIALFLMQKVLAFLSLKSSKFRSVMCGSPLILIEKGVVKESLMRAASYTVYDMMEQLRKKDVFNISDVEYAILETDGDMTVLLKGQYMTPTYKDMNITPPESKPTSAFVIDGKPVEGSLTKAGYNEEWLKKQLKKAGCNDKRDILFALLNADGMMHIQMKQKKGGEVKFIDVKSAEVNR